MDNVKKEGDTDTLIDKVPSNAKIIDKYEFKSSGIPIKVRIYHKEGEYVKTYDISISKISKHSLIILDKIREKVIEESNLGSFEIFKPEGNIIEDKYRSIIYQLVEKSFPTIDPPTKDFFTTFLVQKSLGLGSLEILTDDDLLEEIAINSSKEPIWVFHIKYGWLKTNLFVSDDEQTKHYALSVGRKVGRHVSVAHPMMNANLTSGDRLNATLQPISTHGNTFTLRKFSRDPWTVTNLLKHDTISIEAASFIWQAVEYELSCLVVGGTASGKTSILNVLASFFPPNDRIISIEDTRETQLPKYSHWIPMVTRVPNAEDKGGVSMLDLLVNALRMRPDRMVVGEVRTRDETETLFEAIHTGHSVIATMHANDVKETVSRLTTPPMSISPTLLSSLNLVIVQFRNRRLGYRRTYQVAEILDNAKFNILFQYDPHTDKLKPVNKSKKILQQIMVYSGFTVAQLNKDLKMKQQILKYMMKNKVYSINNVGLILAEYYTNKKALFKMVR